MLKTNNHSANNIFALLPFKAGKISEISETTAASPVPASERINFHIGNPALSDELVIAYLRIILGLPDSANLESYNEELFGSALGLDTKDFAKVTFFRDLIKGSVAYSPRGGFQIKSPIPLVKSFHSWLTAGQDEPLSYDTGERSGKREIVIASGGCQESLRILLHSINSFSEHLPAAIFYWNTKVPAGAEDIKSIINTPLPRDEEKMIGVLQSFFLIKRSLPVYMVIGSELSELSRRELRLLSLKYPLYFIEVNDSYNNRSLAREAGLRNRVLRILTMSYLDKRFKDSSVVFLCGEPDLLKVFEAVHFQLKGTPSASDILLMQYFVDNPLDLSMEDEIPSLIPEYNAGSVVDEQSPRYVLERAGSLLRKSEEILTRQTKVAGRYSNVSYRLPEHLDQRIKQPADYFSDFETIPLFDELVHNFYKESWTERLVKSAEFVFCKEHPEYDARHIVMVSGSSRTALGLLGFHCGINEVISCDLSWNYEHCFPNSTLVPLTNDYELDVESICNIIEDRAKLSDDEKTGIAVIFNNPHNATGKSFPEDAIAKITVEALTAGLKVIDDLAYQNVIPAPELRGPKTVKQIALQLVKEGKIYKEHLHNVISVHSLSKTDCVAGARLAFVEVADERLGNRFKELAYSMCPNSAAVFLAYLFYRSDSAAIRKFWTARNTVLYEKMQAITKALQELPSDRNPFAIEIIAPEASMYPRLIINKLPNGLSLDWLSTELAAQGIGMIPLSSFARTKKGYELARKSFRLTLGGADSPETILKKTRRAVIDLNRIVADEKVKYIRHTFPVTGTALLGAVEDSQQKYQWERFVQQVTSASASEFSKIDEKTGTIDSLEIFRKTYFSEYLPGRLKIFHGAFEDLLHNSAETISFLRANKQYLKERLEKEFYKDSLTRRMDAFRLRMYDRTVHPTQIYSLEPELVFHSFSESFLHQQVISDKQICKFAQSLINEYYGRNIAINSIDESEELLCDLRSLIAAENFTCLRTPALGTPLLSYWGDWDGSNRPSGQGHRLVAVVVMENVNLLAGMLRELMKTEKNAKPAPDIVSALHRLEQDTNDFKEILNHITSLTNQLEQRYKSILPFSVETNAFRKFGIKIKLAKDPVVKLWQHNDRLEKKMIELRDQRKNKLEYYFHLNKELRKTLREMIPLIIDHSSNNELLLKVAGYRDLLKRFALTPRIMQKMITSKDQFAINTTVHNIIEINEIAGNYGNPGMIMGLQVSMSTTPDALISLDRKLQIGKQKAQKNSKSEIADVWAIPLFEDIDSVSKIDEYLDRLWSYAQQSRALDQDVKDRFTEIFCETFIAGSDLSQQIGQTLSALHFKQAKYKTIEWLSKQGLTDRVRLKLGSGEPMQRMGGYYAEFSGMPAFLFNDETHSRFKKHLRQSTIKSTEFAVSPLHGAFAGRDLRTLQSAISERIRQLSVADRSQFLYHLRIAQDSYRSELQRAAEPYIDTRFQYESRGHKELEKLAIGRMDETFLTFAELASENFRHIVYGGKEDVVGIHIISYFLSRAMPVLRDRPVERTVQGDNSSKGKRILERIASTIPLRKHGSLLRAIAHNKSQTFVLGLNQLTTGLFRAMLQFSQQEFHGDSGQIIISEKVMPQLPVYEILATLRLFEDTERKYLSRFYESFPTGFSALTMLREDRDAMFQFIPHLQKELLRRHGVNVGEFFRGEKFISELLPTLRPDLAVLLQNDIFNTDMELLCNQVGGTIPKAWKKEAANLLSVAKEIRALRGKIWELLEEPVRNQTTAFIELAIALHTMSNSIAVKDLPFGSLADKKSKFENNLFNMFRGKVDDSMKQFLSAVMEYLSQLPGSNVEAPIDIVRALKDVERILRVDASALTKEKQEQLNFYIIRMSRLVGDNG